MKGNRGEMYLGEQENVCGELGGVEWRNDSQDIICESKID